MPVTRSANRRKMEALKERHRETLAETHEATLKPMEKNEKNLDDSFSLDLEVKKLPDPFDLLRSSPMKQNVNYKPLSYWAKKVKDLEEKENIKKNKCELYDLSDIDESNSSNKSSCKGKKYKKKVKRQRKKMLGSELKATNWKQYRPAKREVEINHCSVERERIILRKLNNNVTDNKEKFTFKNVPTFALTSTPGKSGNFNLVGCSTFNFFSPIPIPEDIPKIAYDYVSEMECKTLKSQSNPSENKDFGTPKRLRKRRNDIARDRKRVSRSGSPAFDYLEHNCTEKLNLRGFALDGIDPSEAKIHLSALRYDDESLGSFEDSDNVLNKTFLYITDDELSAETGSDKLFEEERLSNDSTCLKMHEEPIGDTNDLKGQEQLTINLTANENQQNHGKQTVVIVNDESGSNQYCSKDEFVVIKENLRFYSDAGNDSSVIILSPETSKTSEDFNCTICNGRMGSGSEVLGSDVEPGVSGEQVSCGRTIVSSPIANGAPTMSEITIDGEFDLPPPIFESTKCESPVRESCIDENSVCEKTKCENLIRDAIKNLRSSELSSVASFRLMPGKKWARSIRILRQSLNGNLLDRTDQKGRAYANFVHEVLSMQIVCQSQNKDGFGNSLVGMMSRLSLTSRSVRNRTVNVLEQVREQKETDCRDIFRNTIDEQLDCTVTDGVNDRFTPEDSPRKKSQMSAEERVLMLCKKKKCLPFENYFNEKTLKNCKKIGEGTFGEVFMCDNVRVIKIMPIEGSDLVNGEPQKKFDEILSEMVIAQELSNLRKGDNHMTRGFCELIESWCVKGEYPQYLIDLWNDFDSLRGSENDSPVMFKPDQLYIVLEFRNGGVDLESFVFRTSHQALSILYQLAFSLAVAEKMLEFEHRDLHWGNILIAPTKKKIFEVVLNGQLFRIPTRGVKVTIIDFTLSRITYDRCSIYNDLSVDPTLFTAQGDYQFEIYRLMKEELRNDWSLFRPKTNLFWLHYVADKMTELVRYNETNTKEHKKGLSKLKEIKSIILNFPHSEDFALNYQF